MNSESQLNESPSKGSRPLCLTNLSAMVLEFLKKNPVTTFSNVADMIIRTISEKYKDISADKTTRRRVYDVLNVFLATGIITKDNKRIRYNDLNLAQDESKTEIQSTIKIKTDDENDNSSLETEDEEEEDNSSSITSDNEKADNLAQESNTTESEIELKNSIIHKIKLYLRYKLLISRNQQITTIPEKPITLPAIFIGVDTELTDIVRLNNNYSIQIRAPKNPEIQFFSPLEILNHLEFPIEYQKEVFHREMPEFLEFEQDIFPEETEEE